LEDNPAYTKREKFYWVDGGGRNVRVVIGGIRRKMHVYNSEKNHSLKRLAPQKSPLLPRLNTKALEQREGEEGQKNEPRAAKSPLGKKKKNRRSAK